MTTTELPKEYLTKSSANLREKIESELDDFHLWRVQNFYLSEVQAHKKYIEILESK